MRARIAVLVLAILASGCVSQSSGEPEADGELSETRTIYFTGNGFEPSSLTVEKGDTVTWINNASSTSMWIGSDRHPTHTNYAGSRLSDHCENGEPTSAVFDQCSTGDRYEFTFEKTGEWGYHNHEPFVDGGDVKVVELN